MMCLPIWLIELLDLQAALLGERNSGLRVVTSSALNRPNVVSRHVEDASTVSACPVLVEWLVVWMDS